MANNYLRYKYYLVTRDAYTALYTVIQNIVATTNLTSGMIIYLSAPTGSNIVIDESTQFSANAAESLHTEIASTSESLGTLHVQMFAGVNSEIKSLSELTGQTVFKLSPGVDTGMRIQHELTVRPNAFVSLRIWYGGLKLEQQLPMTAESNVGRGKNTEINTSIDETFSIKNIDVGNSFHTEINSSSEVSGNVDASVAQVMESEGNSLTNLVLTIYGRIVSALNIEMLSTISLLQSCGISMFNHEQLSDLDSNSLSYYDSWALSNMDLLEI